MRFNRFCASLASTLSVFVLFAIVLGLAGCGGGGGSPPEKHVGIMSVAWMSSGVWVSHVGDPGVPGDSDEGIFTIEFDVTADGGDVWLNAAEPDLSGAGDAMALEIVYIEKGDGVLLGATIASPSGAVTIHMLNGDARFLVREGETERFEMTAVVSALADGLFVVRIADIVYGDALGSSDVSYTGDLDQFFTPDLSLNANSPYDGYDDGYGDDYDYGDEFPEGGGKG